MIITGSVIAIIGGSGFIGSKLAERLSKNFDVKVLDVNIPPPHIRNKVMYMRCDIRNRTEVEKALANVDLVIHTAIVQIPLINEQKKFAYEVNVIGTHNVCEVVNRSPLLKGMILSGSWHTIGERELKGMINEEFGFRPDKVEHRARLYALSKIAQESIVRFYDEMSEKIYGIIRMGTVLGKGMPEKTAANIFITKGLRGEPLTPYKHSMYRPMLYVDVEDVCKAYESFASKILNDEVSQSRNSLDHIVNVYYPEPITILELAETVKEVIIKYSKGKINPEITIVDTGQPILFTLNDKRLFRVDISKAQKYLQFSRLIHPRESIENIVKNRLE